eukprot:TRINITY_DN3843_c1_g1_i1.p1 TRINITY_DN3843_c1_g1~~TRINITY_DN3843_c1_g1_i1.p1  ORF type:complete len:281 (+),score=22.89 TRINITY_DN3843_c1_g1_i1:45-845(+)
MCDYVTPPQTPRNYAAGSPTSEGYQTAHSSPYESCIFATPMKCAPFRKDILLEDVVRVRSWNPFGPAWEGASTCSPNKRLGWLEGKGSCLGPEDGVIYDIWAVYWDSLPVVLAGLEQADCRTVVDFKGAWVDDCSDATMVMTLPPSGPTLPEVVSQAEFDALKRQLSSLLNTLHGLGASFSSFSPQCITGSLQEGYKVANVTDIRPKGPDSESLDHAALNDFLRSLKVRPNDFTADNADMSKNPYLLELWKEVQRCRQAVMETVVA